MATTSKVLARLTCVRTHVRTNIQTYMSAGVSFLGKLTSLPKSIWSQRSSHSCKRMGGSNVRQGRHGKVYYVRVEVVAEAVRTGRLSWGRHYCLWPARDMGQTNRRVDRQTDGTDRGRTTRGREAE